MSIRPNMFSNSGDITKGLQNVAAMFAPPAPADLANYAQARQLNQRSDIVEQLAKDPRYAGFDRQAILADLYDPSSSFYAVDEGNATTRRGQDISAQTALTNNALDNKTSVIGAMFGPLNQGQVRLAVPASVLGDYGLPTLPQVAGASKPMSETEWNATQNQRLLDQGALTDQNLIDLAFGKQSPVIVAGPEGPTYQSPGAAIGQPAYIAPSAQSKPTNAVAMLKDGTTVPAVQGPDGVWKHAQTGQPLPTDIQIFDTPKPQGTASDVGLGKPAQNYIDRALIDIAVAKDTATKLRDLIAESPASQGVVGFLRGTAQNVVQTGGELGTFFGGRVAEVANDIKSGLADADLAGSFDPKIPAIEMLANLLAFQYAKTTTGERLSNEMLRASRAALGLDGLDANQANSLARLNQAIAQIASQEAILKKAKGHGVDSLSTPAVGGGGDAPEGWDAGDWAYLSDDEKAQVLNGE